MYRMQPCMQRVYRTGAAPQQLKEESWTLSIILSMLGCAHNLVYLPEKAALYESAVIYPTDGTDAIPDACALLQGAMQQVAEQRW